MEAVCCHFADCFSSLSFPPVASFPAAVVQGVGLPPPGGCKPFLLLSLWRTPGLDPHQSQPHRLLIESLMGRACSRMDQAADLCLQVWVESHPRERFCIGLSHWALLFTARDGLREASIPQCDLFPPAVEQSKMLPRQSSSSFCCMWVWGIPEQSSRMDSTTSDCRQGTAFWYN